MKSSELKKNKPEELSRLALDKKKELGDLVHGTAGSKNKNVKQAKMIKRDIARILTEINSRSVAK